MRLAFSRLPGPARLGVLITVLVVAAVATGSLPGAAARQTATAYFTQAKGLYEGDAVQILGVRVGTVTKIRPEPGRVRVDFDYAAEHPVPADAKALIMAPSVVPVRNLTLTPVHRGGPRLADGAVIPLSRTAVPVEWDEIKRQLDRLATALGPDGANRPGAGGEGALSRLLNASAANLKGQGTDLNATLRALSEAMSTLADGSGDLFATVRNLRVFIDALARSDTQVVQFNKRLTTVAGILNDDGDELAAALDGLNKAFKDVNKFLRENRDDLKGALEELQPVTDMLAENRQQLADTLHFVPTALSNFYNMYDPMTGALNGSLSVAWLQSPATLICASLYSLGGKPQDCQTALGPLAKLVTASNDLPVGLSPVERNGRSNQVVARPGPEPSPGSPSARPKQAAPGLPDVLLPGGGGR